MGKEESSEREPLGYCQGAEGTCESGLPAKWQRQNTSYADDESNWVHVCDDCIKHINAYWQERWDEHWANVL